MITSSMIVRTHTIKMFDDDDENNDDDNNNNNNNNKNNNNNNNNINDSNDNNTSDKNKQIERIVILMIVTIQVAYNIAMLQLQNL